MTMCPRMHPCPSCGAPPGWEMPRFIDNAPKWQPIETAPKDGSYFMGLFQWKHDPDYDVGRVRWSEYYKCWCYSTHKGVLTHWMPMHEMPQPAVPDVEVG